MKLTFDSGQLPVGWETKTLGELCRKITDGVHHTPKYIEAGIPFLSVKDFTQGIIDFRNTKFISLEDHKVLIKRCKPEIEDILYTKVGTTGVAKVVDTTQEFSLFVSVALLKPKHEIIFNKYLEHFLNSKLGRVQALKRTRGMANKNLVIKDISEITVSYPVTLPEQKRIVGILDEAFEAIDRTIRNTEKNLANARELFESYLNGIFTQKGDGWVEKKLSEVCEKITDGTHQTPKYFETGFVFLSSRNVTSGTIDWDQVKYIDEAQHIAMQKRVSPRIDDILLAKNGTTGVAALVDKDIDFDIYVSLALLRPLAAILPRFMLHFVNSPVAKEQFNKRLKGIGVPNLHLKEIREVTICYPQELTEQESIVINIHKMQSEIVRLETIYRQKLAALKELKQSILQKAFTGELTADTANQKTKAAKEGIAA